ncbi:MAG: hypothetical protein GX446_14495 [Chthonomonadales bacterium]|nr:hypothetical protein [Chthonomonadales bacterium]
MATTRDGPWTLVARTEQPALIDAPCAESGLAQGALRVSGTAAVLALSAGRAIKVIPARSTPAARDVLTVRPAESLGAILKLVRDGTATIGLLYGGRIVPVREGYAPSDGDWLVLELPISGVSAEEVQKQLAQLGADYRKHASETLRARGGKPTKGALRVSANLKPGTSAMSVTFLLDGVPVALLNRAPFQVLWDTRDWSDGEHLIEVRALDERGMVLTRTKTLVLVANAG